MKIFCIGRNYLDHAKELNNPVPNKPMVFMKPRTALLEHNKPFYYPDFTQDLQYETEIVLRMCRHGKSVEEKFAHKYFDQIALGIDFTARDIQQQCKEKGHPWEIAKGFDKSAPISSFFPYTMDEGDIEFSMKKNEEIVQEGNTKEMIFSFAEIIAYVSIYFTLQKGDLIFTGTPAGVGPVQLGDKLEGFIRNNKVLSCEIK